MCKGIIKGYLKWMNVGDRATRWEERKVKDEVYLCDEGEHACCWYNRERYREQGEVETDEPLWRTLVETTERIT